MKLVQTCGACPEQYDVYDEGGNQIGYMRLRYGHFSVSYGGPGGPIVYEATTIGDGIFDPSERDLHLRAGLAAIIGQRPLTYEVEYE
jgi:hypothetical protein